MSNAMDKIINSALDAVEEHVVQRLEDTGLVVFDDDDDENNNKRTSTKGRNVVQKLKLMREEKKQRKETREKKRKEIKELQAERKREDKASDAKLMEIVKKAQQQQQRETSDANDTTKEKDAVLVKALLKEVQRLRERVKTSYEEEENEGENMENGKNVSSLSSSSEEEDSILLSAIEEIESTSALRSELDVSLRQLQRSKQSTVDSELLEKEREGFEERLTREVEKKTKVLEVRKSAAENAADQARKKFAEAEQNLRELRKRHDEAQSRIFDLENNEMEMKSTLAKDRESLKLEAEKLQKREEEFVNKTNNVINNGGGVGMTMRSNNNSLPELGVAALEEKLQVKERMIAKLAEDVEEMENASVAVAKEAEKNVASLTKQLTETKLKLEETKRELMKEQSNAERSGAKVVEELRERVRVLQALVDSEDGDVAEAMAIRGSDDTNERGEGEEDEGNGGKPLIAVRDKNRRLAAEIAVAKRAKDDANKEKEVAVERAVAAETKLMQAAETISVLEDDLAKRTTSTSSAATQDPSSSSTTTTTTTDTDMIAILASQRDRFKRRVSELDEEKARVTTELSSTSAKVTKLEEDNVKLFEKIRYVQKYYASKLSGGASAAVKILRVDESGVPLSDSLETEKSANKSARYSCGVGGVTIGVDRLAISDGMRKRAHRYGCGFGGGGHGDLESASLGGDEGGVVGRYRDKYLARLNPFNAFKRTESEDGGSSNLATHDRLAMAGGKALLSSRGFRSFFALYFLAMHGFLAMVLYSHRAKLSLD
jgi:homeobox protein cut-like